MSDYQEEEKCFFDWHEYTQRLKKQKENIKPLQVVYQIDSCYQIDIATNLFILGKKMSSSATRSIWKVEPLSENEVQLEVIKKDLLQLDSQMKDLIELVEKVNKAADVLKLRLNKDNTIDYVLNSVQILKTGKR